MRGFVGHDDAERCPFCAKPPVVPLAPRSHARNLGVRFGEQVADQVDVTAEPFITLIVVGMDVGVRSRDEVSVVFAHTDTTVFAGE